MNTSQAGINLIKQFEGCRLTAYKCPAGVWTIGVGHTGKVDGKAVCAGMQISQAKADEVLKNDLKRFENYVTATKLKLNQNQFDALVSFTFNCGSGCLQSLVKNRTLSQVGDALLLYNKAGGKVLAGLTRRRQAERALFMKSTAASAAEHVQAGTKSVPYNVRTTCALNIRSAAGTNYPVIRVAKKGEILKVWAVCTNCGEQWGKNGKEFYCLKFCETV